METRGNRIAQEENIVYSGTTIGNLITGLEEKDGNILFKKIMGVHDLPDLYFTPNLSKAAFYAFRNYLNDKNGRAIVLEGPRPENYSLDPNQNGDEAFITREPLKINNIWISSAKLTDPAFNVNGIYTNPQDFSSEFRKNNLEIKDLEGLKKILHLHR